MKKLALFSTVFVACFLGVLAAFQINHFFSRGSTLALSSDKDFPYGTTAIYADLPNGPADFKAAAKRVMPCIVSIDQKVAQRNLWTDRVQLATAGRGSGVIISADGLILTNNHVISGAAVVTVRTQDNKTYTAEVVGADPRSDLAVIKINANALTPIELGDSDKLDVGQWVLAVGNPLGYSNTVSAGIVSSLKRTLPVGEEGQLYIDAIQTDAAINPGNSGGALCNDQGQLIGINSAIASNSGGSVGVGFAIPINRAKKAVHDIVKFGHVRYGEPGFTILLDHLQDSYAQAYLADHFQVNPPANGLIIGDIDPNGPAAKNGIRQLDVLLSVDGEEMRDPTTFYKLFADKKPGDTVTVKYWDGQNKQTQLTLQDLSATITNNQENTSF